MTAIAAREALSNAIRYWERGRIIYNLVLAAIVVGYFAANWPGSASRINMDLGQGIFLLAVLANVAYCAAYIPDMLAQMSDLRPMWLRYRWGLFLIGLTFAGIITRFLALGMFTNAA
jgi:hypothetical protein